MSIPSLDELRPTSDHMILIKKLEDLVFNSAYELLKNIDELKQRNKVELSIATTESLTAGLIMSSLVHLPICGWAKYGCLGVYDTDAKRVMNSVKVDDVYTHRCAKEMAIGLLKNSNATFAISVTGNAMPYFENLNRLGEVFIGIAAYGSPLKGSLFSRPRFIYETFSLNNCLLQDALGLQIKSVCDSWLNQQPAKGKFAKYSDTSALSRMIRNFTAYHAIYLATLFIQKHGDKMVIPEFIRRQRKKNELNTDCLHLSIPSEKYPHNLSEDEVNQSKRNKEMADSCKRVHVKELSRQSRRKPTPRPRTRTRKNPSPGPVQPRILNMLEVSDNFRTIETARDDSCGIHTLLEGIQLLPNYNPDKLRNLFMHIPIQKIKNNPVTYSSIHVMKMRDVLATFAETNGLHHTPDLRNQNTWLSEDDLFVAAKLFEVCIVIYSSDGWRVLDPSKDPLVGATGIDKHGPTDIDHCTDILYIKHVSGNHWELLVPH